MARLLPFLAVLIIVIVALIEQPKLLDSRVRRLSRLFIRRHWLEVIQLRVRSKMRGGVVGGVLVIMVVSIMVGRLSERR